MQDSDFDFYVIMHNNTNERMLSLTTKPYKAINNLRTRAVDIIVNKENRFDSRKDLSLTLENRVDNVEQLFAALCIFKGHF